MRSFWVGSGWKMNHLRKDAEDYVKCLTNYLAITNLDFNVFYHATVYGIGRCL